MPERGVTPPGGGAARAPIREEAALFFTALQFLTRLPAPRWVGWSPAQQAASARHLPSVGWLVGAVQGAVLLAAGWVWSPWVAALLALAAGLLLTGGFHEDGLIDTADGLGGGADRARVLAIMKDSRVGSYGVLAAVVALGLKTALLAHLLGPQGWALAERAPQVLLAVVAAHAASRWAALAVMQRLPYVREAGEGKSASMLLAPLGAGAFTLASAVAALPLALLAVQGRPVALALLVLLPLLAWAAARSLRRRLGGCTGDALGAVQQVAELVVLLTLTAFTWL